MIRGAAAGILLILCMHVSAQHFYLDSLFLKRAHIAIGGGVAIPLLSYGKSNSNQIYGPNALSGYQSRLELGYETGRSMGLIASWMLSSNPFNTDAYAQFFKTNLPYYSGDKFTQLSSSPYYSNALLLGIFYPLRITNTTYEVRLQGGVMNLTRPAQDVVYANGLGDEIKLHIDESESTAAMIAMGIGVRFRLSKDVLLKGWLDYQYGKQKFVNVTMHDRKNGLMYIWIDETSTYVHLFSAGAALCVQFR